MPLEPDVAMLLEQLKALPALETLPVKQARALVDELARAGPVSDADVVSEDFSIPTPAGEIPLRIYHPNQPQAIIVYFHGGGWTLGNLDSVDASLRDFSAATNCCIVSVDYRLAPEHPFPCALEDAYEATLWADMARANLVSSQCPLLVAGDSAGGNLATVVAQMATLQDGPTISGQVLFYPVTDTNTETASYLENAEGRFLTRSLMQWFLDQYLPNQDDRTNPRAAPLRSDDLSALPPALIQTAECDPLRDEGEAYAERLIAAGVEVALQRRLGLIHGYFTMASSIESAARALDDAVAWVNALCRLRDYAEQRA